MGRGRRGGASNYRGFVVVKTIHRCPTCGEEKVFRTRIYDRTRRGEVNTFEVPCRAHREVAS